jgi:ribonuclease P protein component
MIPRAYRFHGRNSLSFAYRRGKTVRGPLCSIRYIKRSSDKKSRVAVVVSRKVNKLAVVRNRIRRRLYEAVRLNLPNFTEPYDIIINVYSDKLADDIEFEELKVIVYSQLKQAGIIV